TMAPFGPLTENCTVVPSGTAAPLDSRTSAVTVWKSPTTSEEVDCVSAIELGGGAAEAGVSPMARLAPMKIVEMSAPQARLRGVCIPPAAPCSFRRGADRTDATGGSRGTTDRVGAAVRPGWR